MVCERLHEGLGSACLWFPVLSHGKLSCPRRTLGVDDGAVSFHFKYCGCGVRDPESKSIWIIVRVVEARRIFLGGRVGADRVVLNDLVYLCS